MWARRSAAFVVFAAVAMLLPAAPALAGTRAPDLEPEHGYWGSDDDAHAGAVADALLGSTPARKCQMVFLPSFEPENAVYLVRGRGRVRGPATVVATETERHIWSEAERVSKLAREGSITLAEDSRRGALARVSRTARTATATLDAATATLLERVWERMLARTRVPQRPNRGKDGITYHAAHFVGRTYRCGTTWSPEDGTLTHDFVDLAAALQRHARSTDRDRPAIQRELRSKAEALLARIAEANRQKTVRAPAAALSSRRVPPAPCDIKWRPPDPNDCATCPTKAMRETKATRETK
jgi:hypothetical protein